MNYLLPVLKGLLLTILSFPLLGILLLFPELHLAWHIVGALSLACPVVMLLALPFITWDKEPSVGSDGTWSVIRGRLPSFLADLETPDEHFPGGSEPTLIWIYNHFGRYAASWYWAGTRNCLMTLAVRWGRPSSDYLDEEPNGWLERGDIWRWSVALGPLKFVMGYQVYRMLDGSFRAAPIVTLKRYG